MPFQTGTRLGPFEIVATLGAGGMGEVYRARDTKLNRTVAIKSLQTGVAADPDRIARFEREAQLLASLNHPHIGGIHGLQEVAGATYLVLEFIDGKPLDVLLRQTGAMQTTMALPIARQIADAIAAAHERGIIHRDLKPGNVMITADDQVKVLDFGLGKSLSPDSAPGTLDEANSPTITLGGTQAGMILGTAGYMSPEQAKGRPADKRSDVWSFGCLLFEMLSGRRAFQGEDVTDTIAAIVRGEPDWKALPESTPPPLRRLIERCLVKDRTQRLSDMSVVRYVLSESGAQVPGASETRVPVSSGSQVRGLRVPVVAAIVALAIAGTAIVMRYWSGPAPSSTTEASLSRFSLMLPDGLEVAYANMVPLAIAPNGRAVVFPAQRLGKVQLYIHDFATGEVKNLDGTDDARSPFFSPDGRWIGFFSRGKLKKITIGGTSLQELADAPDARGGAWGPDDTIYYTPRNSSGLWRIAASGGVATELTTVDAAKSEVSHRNPYVVEGGQALLFLVWTGPGSDEHHIEYLTLADGKRQVVLQNADGPISVVNGQLIYGGRQDTLLAAPWDPSRPSLQGVEPKTLPFLAMLDNEGVAASAIAANGTVVHVRGDANRRLSRVDWIDRTGATETLPIPERDYVSAAISPDGTRAAIQIRSGKEEIWIYNFGTKSFAPLVMPGSSQAPVWSVDSRYIVYRGTRQGFRNIYMKAADGSGDEIRLTTKTGVLHTPMAVTPDGKWVIFLDGGNMSSDVWKVAIAAPHEIHPLLTTAQAEISTQVSPNGKWVTFDSQVSGRAEIWMQPFLAPPSGAAMRQLTHDGGRMSRWSHDSRELYFISPDGLMVISVNGESFSQPRLLVRGRFRPSTNANTNYDVARDGRFLIVQSVQPSPPPTRIEVVLNGVAR